MKLHRVERGAATGRSSSASAPRVVLVHGFTQTAASWDAVASLLEPDHSVVTVDAPGHGRSTAVAADLDEGARLLGEAGGRAFYVGYSMGGRLALRLALTEPELVIGLVLIGATAGIDEDEERRRRRRSDEELAAHVESVGVPAFLDRWLSQDLFEGLPQDPDERASRLANTPSGLASSLRLAGTGTMDPPWWDSLHSISAPTVVVAGARDERFTALGHRLVAGIGSNARFAGIDRAGHAAHLHDPRAVADLVRTLTRPR